MTAEQWTQINQVIELVKQEGDVRCSESFDWLLAEVKHVSKEISWFEEAKKLAEKVSRQETALREISRIMHKCIDQWGDNVNYETVADLADKALV